LERRQKKFSVAKDIILGASFQIARRQLAVKNSSHPYPLMYRTVEILLKKLVEDECIYAIVHKLDVFRPNTLRLNKFID
jgi:hypothetical protein